MSATRWVITPVEENFVAGPGELCIEVSEDLPWLAVYASNSQIGDAPVVRVPLAPDACRKLALQALACADANEWDQDDAVTARGRFLAFRHAAWRAFGRAVVRKFAWAHR